MPTEQPVFHPMPGRVVVELITSTEYNGIIIPAVSQKERVMGTILAIGGDEAEGEEWDLAVGDTVCFGRSSGIELEVDRARVLVLRTAEILCKLTWEPSTDA